MINLNIKRVTYLVTPNPLNSRGRYQKDQLSRVNLGGVALFAVMTAGGAIWLSVHGPRKEEYLVHASYEILGARVMGILQQTSSM